MMATCIIATGTYQDLEEYANTRSPRDKSFDFRPFLSIKCFYVCFGVTEHYYCI